jgi:hypothetical protein
VMAQRALAAYPWPEGTTKKAGRLRRSESPEGQPSMRPCFPSSYVASRC